MLKCDNNAKKIVEAFHLDENDLIKIEFFMEFYKECNSTSKTIERIWVDETINDNTKAFAVLVLEDYSS